MTHRWLALAVAIALLIAMSEVAKRHKRMHYFMAIVSALGIFFLTTGHVWRVIGIWQTLFNYAFLILTGIDHFEKGRSE